MALATVIGRHGSAPRAGGTRMLIFADGRTIGTVGGGAFEHRVIAEALSALDAGRPTRLTVNLSRDLGMCCGGAMEAFIEPLTPLDSLVIYGAGHVGTATAALAARLGFQVTVVDDRDDWADPARFGADVDVRCQHPLRHCATVPDGPRSYCLIVTHDHALDQDLVEQLLPRELAWLGLIGSRTKAQKFRFRFRAAGMDPALFGRLRSPVGLDIGAQTPEEIAVSIAAELIRVRHGVERPPLPLCDAPQDATAAPAGAEPI